MEQIIAKPDSPSVTRLKQEAQRLFARRGIDGVTVRDIAKAAGQKNPAAVGYHFGSKEGLIHELVLDGAKIIDDRRDIELDALEGAGGPHNIAEIVDVLIYPAINLAGTGETDSFNRFMKMLSMSHRDMLVAALDGHSDSSYQRCLRHLRKVMPDMSRAKQNQRFIFMEEYLNGVLAARETRLEDTSREHPVWNDSSILKHFAATLTHMLEMPSE